MRFCLFCVGLSIHLAASVAAGPWLRADGSGFASTSVTIDETGAVEGSAYLEYGFSDALTIGGKIDHRMAPHMAGDGAVLAFVRGALGPTDQTLRYAWDLGLGYRYGGLNDAAFAYAGISLGRGFNWRDRGGWAVLDTSVEYGFSTSDPLYKVDGTLGLTLNDNWQTMFQIFVSHAGSDTQVTLAPSLIWSPSTHKSRYQMGLEYEEGQLALKLALWRDF